MCKIRQKKFEVMDMMSSVSKKLSRSEDNLRVAVLLESTHKFLAIKLKKLRTKKRKSRMQTDEILDMMSNVSKKLSQVENNLRVEVLLESTHKLLKRQLKKEQSRKRKREQIELPKQEVIVNKESRHDDDDVLMLTVDEPLEDELGLDDFFDNLKAVSPSQE